MTTDEQISTGFTKEKIMQYLVWRQEWKLANLPKMYLYFDNKTERRLDKYEYGGGWNYEISFNIKSNLVYYVEDRPSEKRPAYIKQISSDSLQKLDIKDGEWIRAYFHNQHSNSKCWQLSELCSELFIIIDNPEGPGYLVMKPTNCIEEFE